MVTRSTSVLMMSATLMFASACLAPPFVRVFELTPGDQKSGDQQKQYCEKRENFEWVGLSFMSTSSG